MDGNKDEALKCLRIGKDALEGGDRSRALKFLSKARRLDPSLPVDDLLSKIDGAESANHPAASDSSGRPADEPGRPGVGSSSSSSSATSKARVSANGSSMEYTEEQITVVRQIKKEKDYYQILGLERNCTVEDVKKAYRKLSLKVHPDKNKAPGSEEAFKAVSKAFQCLSNEESRKRYDLVGSEEPVPRVPPARHGMNGFGGFYDADIDADEIFRNFFFGGMPQATTPFGTFRFRTGGMGGPAHHDVQGSGSFNLRALIQILPVILLLLINFLPSSEPPYVLSRSYPYELRLETQRGVPYFVKPGKFEQEYPYHSAERVGLEERIEREYVRIVSHNCRLELQRQQWGLANHTPHCDMLQRYEAAATA
uniref:Chaperone protein dnaJ 49 n=1 Tax=Anthurium amnicola TaxID=1678845 RepID=A0A1D1YEL7_9ARAE